MHKNGNTTTVIALCCCFRNIARCSVLRDCAPRVLLRWWPKLDVNYLHNFAHTMYFSHNLPCQNFSTRPKLHEKLILIFPIVFYYIVCMFYKRQWTLNLGRDDLFSIPLHISWHQSTWVGHKDFIVTLRLRFLWNSLTIAKPTSLLLILPYTGV